jgi:hypothetical protein
MFPWIAELLAGDVRVTGDELAAHAMASAAAPLKGSGLQYKPTNVG